jgi:cytochrome c oxidase subunit II
MLNWWLPENVSTYGSDIDSLFYLIYWITMVVWVLVQALMVIFLIRYRDRGDGRRATYTHGNTALEVTWTIVPTLIVVWLGFLSVSTWRKIKIDIPPTDHVVEVTAKQFNWEMRYPGPDKKFDTDDDKVIENDLRVPVNTPIRVLLKSKDVIHSFFVPVLRLKQDAVPGRTIQAWFQATKAGTYEIPCAELCGFGHSGMLGHLTVYEPQDYEKWVNDEWPQQHAQKKEGADDRARTS